MRTHDKAPGITTWTERAGSMRRTLLAVGLATASLAVGTAIVIAGGFQFGATATSAEEVPPTGQVIISTAEAKVNVKLGDDSGTYNLRITEPIVEVRQAHLHLGIPGVNGPIALWLYPAAPPQQLIPGTTEGSLAKGTFDASSLCFAATAPFCPAGVPDWDGFVAALEAGNLYLNVHTTAWPGGEIRGQMDHLGHHGD